MARKKNPNRDKAFELFLNSNGGIANREIAKQLEENEKTISVWKMRDKWVEKMNSSTSPDDCSTTSKNAHLKGNKHAVGNRGGYGAKGNNNATKHGFFKKILPDDALETLEMIQLKSPLDMLWENILIQYTAIARAQKIMFVTDQDDMTKELKKLKDGKTYEEEYEIQFAWDKHASFLAAQSRAMSTLQNMIQKYEELSNTEEQELRIQKLKGEVAKIEKALNTDETGDVTINISLSDEGDSE